MFCLFWKKYVAIICVPDLLERVYTPGVTKKKASKTTSLQVTYQILSIRTPPVINIINEENRVIGPVKLEKIGISQVR